MLSSLAPPRREVRDVRAQLVHAWASLVKGGQHRAVVARSAVCPYPWEVLGTSWTLQTHPLPDRYGSWVVLVRPRPYLPDAPARMPGGGGWHICIKHVSERARIV